MSETAKIYTIKVHDDFVKELASLDVAIRTQLRKKHDMIGEFEAFAIGWRHNLTLFNTLKFLANQFIAIIDNDHDGVIFLNKITTMNFEYFEKWLFDNHHPH